MDRKTTGNHALRPAIAVAAAMALIVAVGVFLLTGAWRDLLHEPGQGKPRQPSTAAHRNEIPAANEPGRGKPGAPEEITGVPAAENKPVSPAPVSESGSGDTTSAPGGVLTLLLLEADGEEPVAGEEFNLRLEGPAKTRNLLVRTDGDGYALLENLAAGEYPALLRHPRYLADRRVLAVPAEESPGGPEVVRVLLEKGELLGGRVTDLRGKAIKGARVTLAAATADGPQRRLAASAEDGTFTIGALTVGAWSLTAFHPGYRAAGPLAVEIPASRELTLRLSDAAGVSISIQNPDGTPCAGARLSIRIIDAAAGAIPVPATRSGAEGRAVLRNLPADPGVQLKLTATDARYPAISRNATIDELEGDGFVLRFAPARSIGGTVLNSTGGPVANARISLEGPRNLFVRSTSSGSFQFKKIPPGEYWLQASAASSGVSRRLLADTEEESLPGLELVLEPGAGAISGRVENDSGQPLGLVPLRLSGGGFSIESVTSAAGTFSFEGLPRASYTLRAGDAKRGQALRRGLGPGGSGIRLVIDKPGSLRGILKSEGPARGFSLRLQEHPGIEARGLPARTWHFTSQTARFHLRDLPPGIYDLLLLRQGSVAGKLERITIRPGEEAGPVSISALE